MEPYIMFIIIAVAWLMGNWYGGHRGRRSATEKIMAANGWYRSQVGHRDHPRYSDYVWVRLIRHYGREDDYQYAVLIGDKLFPITSRDGVVGPIPPAKKRKS